MLIMKKGRRNHREGTRKKAVSSGRGGGFAGQEGKGKGEREGAWASFKIKLNIRSWKI